MSNSKRECPVCQSGHVVLHGSQANTFQTTINKLVSDKHPKYACKECGAYFKRQPDRQHAQKLLLVTVFGLLGVCAVLFSSNIKLVGFGKHIVLKGYQAAYGDEHKTKLKEHWLWLYGANVDSAVTDYERNIQ